MKIKFSGYIGADSTREEFIEAVEEEGTTVEECELLLRIGLKKQLEAALGGDDTKVVISKLDITFEDDPGAGKE